MRRISTTLVLALIAVAAIAGHENASNLVLTTYDHGSFTVRLDGQMYQAYNQLELEEVSPGRHYIRIDRKLQNYNGYGGQGRILYSGYIDIPARSIVRARVDQSRRLAIEVDPLYSSCQIGCAPNACTCDTAVMLGCDDPYGQTVYGAGAWGNGYSNGSNYNPVGAYGYGTQSTACASNSGNYGQYNDNWSPVMSSQGFTEFRRSLQLMNFETAKLNAIQNQLNHARFTAAQTRTMMSLFSFDSSRLKLAKMIYPTVVDPNRYFLVADSFTFHSTREELYHFMQI